jgi:hypothetical protein
LFLYFFFSYLIKTTYLFVDCYTYGPGRSAIWKGMEEVRNDLCGSGKRDAIWRDNQHWGTGWRGGGGKGGVNGKNRGSAKVGGGGYLQPIPNNGKGTGGGYVLPIPSSEEEGDN